MQLWNHRQKKRLHFFIDKKVHEDDEALRLALSYRDKHTGYEIHALTVTYIWHAICDS